MQEYVSEAVVLAKEDLGELDHRISLFTKRYGKLIVRAKSSRKITSKLSAHLEPGNHVRARFVEKKGLHVVDALKIKRVAGNVYDLHFLNEILPEGEPDFQLWQGIMSSVFAWPRMLAILGWDPQGGTCAICASPGKGFHIHSQQFYCPSCASKFRRSEVLYYS